MGTTSATTHRLNYVSLNVTSPARTVVDCFRYKEV